MTSQQKIAQILPADEWVAQYEGGTAMAPRVRPLVAWALETHSANVVGLVITEDGKSVERVDPAAADFLGYVERSSLPKVPSRAKGRVIA